MEHVEEAGHVTGNLSKIFVMKRMPGARLENSASRLIKILAFLLHFAHPAKTKNPREVVWQGLAGAGRRNFRRFKLWLPNPAPAIRSQAVRPW
jgi:hypothetical protein